MLLMIALSSSLYASKKQVLIYCGITMVNPIKEISDILKDELDIDIVITQGGSANLFNSLKTSKVGDIYIAGEQRYIDDYINEGFFTDYIKEIGYNQAAIFVHKGNPYNISSLDDLLRDDISTILCDYNTGSIGKMTKTVLENYGGESFLTKAYLNSVEIGTDSRNINASLSRNRVDMAINWKSTITFGNHKDLFTVIDIDEQYAPKMTIPAVLLKSSENPELARSIIDFIVSDRGKEIMKKYGFLE
ncbi:ABC transporter substrate-binding protein [Arcobacter sp. FWKO B]|nr:ABC transporter substrate-binding protein [Arcobacter sp. FWKO B]